MASGTTGDRRGRIGWMKSIAEAEENGRSETGRQPETSTIVVCGFHQALSLELRVCFIILRVL